MPGCVSWGGEGREIHGNRDSLTCPPASDTLYAPELRSKPLPRETKSPARDLPTKTLNTEGCDVMWFNCFLFQMWELWPKEVENHDRHPPPPPPRDLAMCRVLLRVPDTLGVLHLCDELFCGYFMYVLCVRRLRYRFAGSFVLGYLANEWQNQNRTRNQSQHPCSPLLQ